MLKKHTGFKRLIKASQYSYQGLKHGIINEAALRQEFIASIILIPLACWLDVSTIEHILLIGSLVLVFIVELLNTAIEAIVDRVGLEFHELSGLAKDTGSAAVLVAIFLTVFVWLSILLPHYY